MSRLHDANGFARRTSRISTVAQRHPQRHRQLSGRVPLIRVYVISGVEIKHRNNCFVALFAFGYSICMDGGSVPHAYTFGERGFERLCTLRLPPRTTSEVQTEALWRPEVPMRPTSSRSVIDLRSHCCSAWIHFGFVMLAYMQQLLLLPHLSHIMAQNNAAKRKGPAFKPPRPAKKPAEPAAVSTSKTTSGPASRSAGVTKKPAPARRSYNKATVLNSSDNEDDDSLLGSDLDELMEDIPAPRPAAVEREAPVQPPLEPIPQKLLGRLLQEGFEDDDTRIHRGAMELTTKYIDIFVREALTRAVLERRETNKKGRRGGVTDGFLQVEDLEKVAPQLVLDF
ncbi:hypothetical protein M011DRAFT_287309 [Sporormia fimetaria CBS 119925]|uniref:Uncharacterized protein n=1 Tax=Sporormia fimetaria CBS 119925 TaxID=1340428 RepID=A0A6A6VKG7_9PLEO|nr:hypothetical protein M011DRAFT_287309 [Sporormia fimetaria CBS 119925]